MILYGPRDVNVKKKETVQIFDIVVLSEKNHNTAFRYSVLYILEIWAFIINFCFSLCRLTSKDDAKLRFELYKRCIPTILNIDRDLCTIVSIIIKPHRCPNLGIFHVSGLFATNMWRCEAKWKPYHSTHCSYVGSEKCPDQHYDWTVSLNNWKIT